MTSRDSTTHLLTYLLKGLKVRFPRALPLMPPSFEFPNTRSKRLAGRGTTPGEGTLGAARLRLLWLGCFGQHAGQGAAAPSSFLLSRALGSLGGRGRALLRPPSSFVHLPSALALCTRPGVCAAFPPLSLSLPLTLAALSSFGL